MKATPKTDEVINVLEQAVTVINLMEHNIREIEKADIPTDEAKDVINVYQSNLDYCHSCKVTAKDVYDEYWEICLNVDSLPKCAKAMAVRFENVGIPVWVCDPHSDYIKQISNKIWRMEQQGVITKSQASDLMCLFDLLAKWVMVWVFRVQNILKEMGVEPLPILTDKSEETGEEESDKPTADIAEPQQKQKQGFSKPQQETEREKKYFTKAIEAGLMEKDGEKYRWLHNNGLKASLGYFLNRVFNPKGTAQIPYKRMENLFNETRLDTAIDQALTAKKPQKWRMEIDILFDD